jgi:hypothetical protein
MDTVTVSPIEQDIIIQPAGSSVVIQDTSAAVSIEPGELNVAIQPQENAVNVLTGATIINNYGSDTVAITAAENLGGHRIVTVEGFYASKDTATDKNKVLGMTTGAVSIGSEATVQVSGFIEESSWNWNVDLPVFLSTDGQLTQSAITSGFSLIVGKPRTATNMFISISEPIILI